jgi:hypothetical protein
VLLLYHIRQVLYQEGERKLSNYTAIRELLKQMSGQDNTFTIPRVYVKYTGDLTTAVLLNQIVFYSDKSKRKDGFFYKTYKEWEEEVCLTERQVRHSIKKLKDKGIIETQLKKANGSPTVHYKLLFDKFAESILTFCQNPTLQNVRIQSDDMSESLTEITTETTTEKEIQYAEFVKMKETEYNKLIEEFGKEGTEDRIERLSLYKGSTGKKYKSDYLTILSWERRNKQSKPKKKKEIDWEGFDLD